MLSWLVSPYWQYPSQSFLLPEIAIDLFPAIVVITTIFVAMIGFVFCGWPMASSVPPKRAFRTNSELSFLLFISIFEIFFNFIFLTNQSAISLMISFSLEIAFCVWESFYLGRSRRLPVEYVTHHVSTIFAIPMSLYVPRLPIGLLVQLSLSVAVGNAIVCASKLIYRLEQFSESKNIAKKYGILISYWSSILYRILIPSIDVFWIGFHFFFHLTVSERPGWTRLYLTSLWMLLALNYQMVYTMKKT